VVVEHDAMRACLYLRVSTDSQSTERQEKELREAAARAGHRIVEVYSDNGISGAKGRDKRPAFDRLHNDAVRRRFEIVMAWSVDRLGRSLQDLVSFLHHLHSLRIDLYLHQQGLDTTTPAGKAMFQMLGVFAEFERAMIVSRVRSGLELARIKGTKSGRPIGRPRVSEDIRRQIREAYAAGGVGMRALAKRFNVSLGTVKQACTSPNSTTTKTE
jgi:DNA invertase Pin-like site-specific DNA recombinase